MKKFLINIFIIMNLMMMIRAQLDSKAPVINFIYKPITFIQNYFSMWRGWNMFSPNPLRTNQYVDAKIIYEGAREEIWNFPRPSSNELLSRYMWGERFRKYSSDALRLDTKSYLWKDGAKYVLKKVMQRENAVLPKEIVLRRRWQPIPDWHKTFIPHRTIPKGQYRVFEYYNLKIGQK